VQKGDISLINRYMMSGRYDIYQFVMPNVEPSQKSPIMAFNWVTCGLIVKLRFISDSNSLHVVISSTPDVDNRRNHILSLDTDKEDFFYDYYNGDFLQSFYLGENNTVYIQITNNGSAATGDIICEAGLAM
jgi:hypothetical protein